MTHDKHILRQRRRQQRPKKKGKHGREERSEAEESGLRSEGISLFLLTVWRRLGTVDADQHRKKDVRVLKLPAWPKPSDHRLYQAAGEPT